MSLREDIRNAMIAAGFDPDDETSATSPKYNARLFEAVAGVVKAGMAGSIDWSTFTVYDTPGTYSVTVPEDCDKMIVFAGCGAGGSGSKGYLYNPYYLVNINIGYVPGSSGASGAVAYNAVVDLQGKTSLSITVGKGGAVTDSSRGNSGGATSVNGLFTLSGGAAGQDASFLGPDGGTCSGIKGFTGSHGVGITSWIGMIGPRSNTSVDMNDLPTGIYGISGVVPSRGAGGFSNRAGGDGYLCFAFIRKAA